MVHLWPLGLNVQTKHPLAAMLHCAGKHATEEPNINGIAKAKCYTHRRL